MKQKGVLVTGSNGLIGRELIRLLSSNFKVHALVHSLPQNKNPNVNYIICDLSSNWETSILPLEIYYIIHLAQSEKFREFPETASEVFNVNTYSTVKLLDYAKKNGIEKFIYASSGGIYGNHEHGFKEDFEISINKDIGHYLTTKLISELLIDTYSNIFDTVILRFFFVYGKNQRRSMLIPRLVDNIKAGREIVLQGEAGIKINPIHVSDATMAIVNAMNNGIKGKYNVAGTQELSIRDISVLIGNKLGIDPVFVNSNTRPRNLLGDITKMVQDLHYPITSFEFGVNEIISN